MAVNNNTVQVTAGLACTLLTDPPIGAGSSSFTTGFTDGHVATDIYVALASGVAGDLNTAAGGNAFIKITNPSTTSAVALAVKSGSSLGSLPVAATASTPTSCVIPIGAATILTGTTTADVTVGVTIIRVTDNS